MRATRDLLRRRMHLMRKRAELLAHIQNTNSQYNLPEIGTSSPTKRTVRVWLSGFPSLLSKRASKWISR